MYGQDADLIILGLASHEPHFMLLREQIDFSRNFSKGKNDVKQVLQQTTGTKWQLLHISLLREYLDMEMKLPHQDLERVIDDYVFL